jgi:glycosyltransferase involved in cell wall biosynthesis
MPLALSSRRSKGGGGLITIGRLTAQKRTELALGAHQRLLATFPNLSLTIVGDGPERPQLERVVARLGTTQQVRFIGQVKPDQIAALVGDSDVMIFPAQQEGLGLAAIEALAGGVPVVVCRDGGGVLDIVTEPAAGTIAEPNDAAIAEAVGDLLNTPGRAEAAAQVGGRWRELLAPERVAEFFEARYREALGE